MLSCLLKYNDDGRVKGISGFIIYCGDIISPKLELIRYAELSRAIIARVYLLRVCV